MSKNPEAIRPPDHRQSPDALVWASGAGRGTWFWIWVIGLGVFFVTLLGGLIFIPTIFRQSGVPLQEAECFVFLPNLHEEGVSLHPSEGAFLPKTFSDPEAFRSWLRQNGVLVPPEVVIQLTAFDSGNSSPSERLPSLQKSSGGFSVRLTYQAQHPTEARQAVEEAGQAIAQLWQTQWNQQQAGLRRQFQEMLQQVQSAWIAGNLQEEFFQEYVDQWNALWAVGPFDEEGSNQSGSISHRPVGPQIPESESSGLPEPETSRPPQMVENPQWVALAQTLQQWQSRRQKLLEDRTPIHPEVQQAEHWIAQTESLLAKTPRWLSRPDTFSPSPLPQSSQKDVPSLPSLSPGTSPSSWNSLSSEPPNASRPSRPTAPAHRATAPTPPLSSEQSLTDLSSSRQLPRNLSSSGQSPPPEAHRIRLREFANRLEEFRSFWEVFVARQMQGQEIVHHRLRQVQEHLGRMDKAAQAGLVRLESSVRPIGETTAVGSETWAWKLGGLSLLAGLVAGGLSRAALRRLRPIVPASGKIASVKISTPSLPSPAAKTQPVGIEQKNKTDGLFSPLPISPPPNRPVPQTSFSPSNVAPSEPALPISPDPSPKTDRDPERDTLEDCIRTLEELQAGLSVPVIGAAADIKEGNFSAE